MYVDEMSKDLEIYFAVLLDESRRRALWIRQTLVRTDARATIWGAWFDADASPKTRAAKRFEAGEMFTATGAAGSVDGLAWDVRWWGGKPPGRELPAWVPAPMHAHSLLHDAECEGTVTVDGESRTLRGRALAMHLWGAKYVPTLHWIWTPWLGDASFETTAVSLRDTFSLGLSNLQLDGPQPVTGAPATAAHPHGLLTGTVAAPRRLMHVHAWAEPDELVGYAYRDTDGHDLMVAQSDIGSAHYEAFTRRAPGFAWHLVDERRASGGVAVEIHQRAPLPGVDYIRWEDTARKPTQKRPAPAPRGDLVEWPELRSITALGMTYADHVKETGAKLTRNALPAAFTKHERTFVVGDTSVRVPAHDELRAALVELDPDLEPQLAQISPLLPAVMDYEGELALVAFGPIDDDALAAGIAQPLGLAACNDLTARICQVLGETTPRPLEFWALAKSFPRFLPVAPRVWSPADGLARIPDITLVTRVNGEERQHASTKLLIYDLSALVRGARAHLGRPLARGDVVLTGTPSGVGMRLSWVRRRFAKLVKERIRKAELLVSMYATSNALLRPGDVVEVDAGPAGSVRARLVV
jgi:2-keto-4-pentenoate hydratase/2-oxohepta-3-ene-1,7-dioic acid hydratase in catechol pathway